MTAVILNVLSVFSHDDREIFYFLSLSFSIDLEGGRALVHAAIPPKQPQALGLLFLLSFLSILFLSTSIYGHLVSAVHS